MDLVQAEAVRDLVRAETAWQARNAREQLDGLLSRRLVRLRDGLVELLARLEASLDFADHGVALDPDAELARLARCREALAALLATAAAGERIRDGVRVVIVGSPNSGKSTLFNTLLGRERAIVGPHPGTTRDVLEAELEIAGLRVALADTAGLREAADPVEEEGVRRAGRAWLSPVIARSCSSSSRVTTASLSPPFLLPSWRPAPARAARAARPLRPRSGRWSGPPSEPSGWWGSASWAPRSSPRPGSQLGAGPSPSMVASSSRPGRAASSWSGTARPRHGS